MVLAPASRDFPAIPASAGAARRTGSRWPGPLRTRCRQPPVRQAGSPRNRSRPRDDRSGRNARRRSQARRNAQANEASAPRSIRRSRNGTEEVRHLTVGSVALVDQTCHGRPSELTLGNAQAQTPISEGPPPCTHPCAFFLPQSRPSVTRNVASTPPFKRCNRSDSGLLLLGESVVTGTVIRGLNALTPRPDCLRHDNKFGDRALQTCHARP